MCSSPAHSAPFQQFFFIHQHHSQRRIRLICLEFSLRCRHLGTHTRQVKFQKLASNNSPWSETKYSSPAIVRHAKKNVITVFSILLDEFEVFGRNGRHRCPSRSNFGPKTQSNEFNESHVIELEPIWFAKVFLWPFCIFGRYGRVVDSGPMAKAASSLTLRRLSALTLQQFLQWSS